MATPESLAMVELCSIARGYRVVDSLVKRAPVQVIEANRVEPGRFLILFGGGVAEVEEAFVAAMEAAGDTVVDKMLLPMVHESIIPAFSSRVGLDDPDTVGVLEGSMISTALVAADAAVKNADVELCGLRVTPAMGGKLLFVLHGVQHDVEVAIEVAEGVMGDSLVGSECIAMPHPEFLEFALRAAPFEIGRS